MRNKGLHRLLLNVLHMLCSHHSSNVSTFWFTVHSLIMGVCWHSAKTDVWWFPAIFIPVLRDITKSKIINEVCRNVNFLTPVSIRFNTKGLQGQRPKVTLIFTSSKMAANYVLGRRLIRDLEYRKLLWYKLMFYTFNRHLGGMKFFFFSRLF